MQRSEIQEKQVDIINNPVLRATNTGYRW